MKLYDLLSFLPPTGLAALEYALTESLDEDMPDDLFCSVLNLKEAVQQQGAALCGGSMEDYIAVSCAISARLEDYGFGDLQL